MAAFSQTITLEGAEEIKRQLEEIGKAGEKAFSQFQKTLEDQKKSLAGVNTGFGNFKGVMEGLQGQANALSGSIAGLAQSFLGFSSLGIAGVVSGLALMTRSAGESAIALRNNAAVLGLSVQSYQGLAAAARQAGVDTDTFNATVTRFQRAAANAAEGQRKAVTDLAKGVVEQFNKMGLVLTSDGPFKAFGNNIRFVQTSSESLAFALEAITNVFKSQGITPTIQQTNLALQQYIKTNEEGRSAFLKLAGSQEQNLTVFERMDRELAKANGDLGAFVGRLIDTKGNLIPLDESLLKFADELNKIEDPAQKSARALQFLPRTGAQLIPFLNLGRERIKAIKDELARRSDPVFKEEDIETAFRARLAFQDAEKSITGLKNTVGVAFAPAFQLALAGITASVKDLRAQISEIGASFTRIKSLVLDLIPEGTFKNLLSDETVSLFSRFVDVVSKLPQFNPLGALANGLRAIEELIRVLPGKVNEAVEAIKNFFGSLPPALQIVGEKMGGAIVDGLRSAFPRISATIDAIKRLGGFIGSGAGADANDQTKSAGPSFGAAPSDDAAAKSKTNAEGIKQGFVQLGAAGTSATGKVADGFGKAGRAASTFASELKKPIDTLSDSKWSELFNQKTGGSAEIAGRDFGADPFASFGESEAAITKVGQDRSRRIRNVGGRRRRCRVSGGEHHVR